MKKITIILIAAVAAAVSCSKVKELDDRVGKLETRMDAVEAEISKINTNIASLQTIVDALSQKDYIKEVKDIKDASNKIIGYELIFDKKGSVKIYHGTNGQDGSQGPQGEPGTPGATPQIGVAMFTDGLYYWTLNGSWLTDAAGNKIVAVGRDGSDGSTGATGAQGPAGSDGKDGVTPRLKIEGGNWYVWYNETDGWVQLGVATGVTTSEFFTSVYKDGNYLVLQLASGDSYRIPIGSQLAITYNADSVVAVQPGASRTIHYVISTFADKADIEVLASGNVKAKIVNQTGFEGDIQVLCGNEIDEYCKVVVLVTDGVSIITDRFVFEVEGMTITDNTLKPVAAAAGDLEIEFLTNTDFSVVIPAEAQSWISCIATKALSLHGMTLRIAANTGVKRSAVVSAKSKISDLKLDYTIVQEGAVGEIKFVYSGTAFSGGFPAVTGNTTGGTINWGDAVSTAWGTFTHSYTDGAPSHTISIAVPEMTTVSFSKLTGISAIDVSGL